MTNPLLLHLHPTPPFDFKSTVYSSGWVELAPSSWDNESSNFKRVECLRTGRVILLEIRDTGSIDQPEIEIAVKHQGKLATVEEDEIQTSIAYMLRLDEDLSGFYELCKQRGGYWLEVTKGKGRLLRSPSLFEDMVKTICTTNIQWGGTKRMVNELVNTYGEVYPSDLTIHAFPTASSIANVSPQVFAESVKLGYRADYIYQLAQRVVSGDLDLEYLKNGALPTPELKKKLLAIRGIGNYATATILMLLGRYDELAVDTAFRQFVSKKYFNDEPPSDAEARSIYVDWGEWKYLAYWFDIWQEYASS